MADFCRGVARPKKCGVECGHTWCSGDRGMKPPMGSRSTASAQEFGRKAPWSWKHFSYSMPNGSRKFASVSVFWKLSKHKAFATHLYTTEGIVTRNKRQVSCRLTSIFPIQSQLHSYVKIVRRPDWNYNKEATGKSSYKPDRPHPPPSSPDLHQF